MNAEAVVALVIGIPTLIIALFAWNTASKANDRSDKANVTAEKSLALSELIDRRNNEQHIVTWVPKWHPDEGVWTFRNEGLHTADDVTLILTADGVGPTVEHRDYVEKMGFFRFEFPDYKGKARLVNSPTGVRIAGAAMPTIVYQVIWKSGLGVPQEESGKQFS